MPYELLTQEENNQDLVEQKIFYIDQGEGKDTILFLHGWYKNSREEFRPYLDYFKTNSRIVAFDLPGHGASFKDKESDYSLNTAFKTTRMILDKIETKGRITLIGHGLGGYLALKLGLLESKKIDNLILISPVIDFLPFDDELKGWLSKPDLLISAGIFVRAMSGRYPFNDRIDTYNTEQGQKVPNRLKHYRMKIRNHPLYCSISYMRSFIGSSLKPLIRNNILPTLLIYGSKDNLTPAEYGSSIASQMPRSILKIFPDGGHNVHLSHKEEIIPLINEFISGNEKKESFWLNLFKKRNN